MDPVATTTPHTPRRNDDGSENEEDWRPPSLGAALVTVLALCSSLPRRCCYSDSAARNDEGEQCLRQRQLPITPTRADAPPGFVKARFTAAAR